MTMVMATMIETVAMVMTMDMRFFFLLAIIFLRSFKPFVAKLFWPLFVKMDSLG